jgi:hypothetical protein
MENYFKGFSIEHIERSRNTEANELVKIAAKKMTSPLPNIFSQILEDSSVKTVESEPRIVNIIQGEDWRAPIMVYPHHHYEPDSKT